MGNNPSKAVTCDNYPVTNVGGRDVEEFISKLNAATGKNYRLPTEAEWEYAARGGNKSRGYKYSGSNNLDNVAWYFSNSGKNPSAVGIKRPNELGIYDMSGNVEEMCNSTDDPYSSNAQTDPQGEGDGWPVLRGGSLMDISEVYFRVSSRRRNYAFIPGSSDTGFRLASSSK